MPKITGVWEYRKLVDPKLSVEFLRGSGISRCPFFGMDLTMGEKVKSVHIGAPDSRSGNAIVVERPE